MKEKQNAQDENQVVRQRFSITATGKVRATQAGKRHG